jgi:acyl CoA:acetate/3-ketoacid CoA transferase alpha subunit
MGPIQLLKILFLLLQGVLRERIDGGGASIPLSLTKTISSSVKNLPPLFFLK